MKKCLEYFLYNFWLIFKTFSGVILSIYWSSKYRKEKRDYGITMYASMKGCDTSNYYCSLFHLINLTVLIWNEFHNIRNIAVNYLTKRIQSGSCNRFATSEPLDCVWKDPVSVDQCVSTDSTISNGFPEWVIRNHSIHLNIIEMLTWFLLPICMFKHLFYETQKNRKDIQNIKI